MIKTLRLLNPHFTLHDIHSDPFKKYGTIIHDFDFSSIESYIHKNYKIADDHVDYIANLEYFQNSSIKSTIENDYFGGMEVEIGWCSGQNDKMGGLEYHIGNEMTIALTNLLIILGDLRDVEKYKYDSRNTEIFFVPKGTVYNLYATTLHYAPCQTEKTGFETIVILPALTNTPLVNKTNDKLLFMRNKWLMVHPDNTKDIALGAYPGIVGENIKLNY